MLAPYQPNNTNKGHTRPYKGNTMNITITYTTETDINDASDFRDFVEHTHILDNEILPIVTMEHESASELAPGTDVEIDFIEFDDSDFQATPCDPDRIVDENGWCAMHNITCTITVYYSIITLEQA
jgi:hypothetical protein